MVTVKYRGRLCVLTGKAAERLTAGSIREVLKHINAAYGAVAYQEAKRMLITVDEESILLHGGLSTALTDGAVVSFFPIAGGG